jgi:hypothetical protein
MPEGREIVLGKPRGEARILQIAHGHERSADWHKRRPRLAPKLQGSSSNLQS